ncbi:winged helix-turn-helix transcriptional regulator [Priestia megaterium]|uniref:winged helix-turn-helix transcriptional regulator n=1 Tax=Priestia megaterium TaxID=1404 RepID=UPI00272F3206|nr:winged helix-turn-helix transcriptional regulator [Priestia megaterium]MDP1442115.1 winged helix-turn-helix transcriptional regulator [Priestia megaterium]MDP1471108.1 winged helix-turn-helix transcriptional regulator [Priestia megaterium]
MRDLLNNEKLRFSELQRAIPEISKKMLTTHLRELEYHDIIDRKVYAEVPSKVKYPM